MLLYNRWCMYAFTVEWEPFCSLVGCPRSTRSRFTSWLEVEHGTPTSIIALIKHLVEGHRKPSCILNSEWIIFGNYVRAKGRNIGSTTDAYPVVVRYCVILISTLKYLAHLQFRLKEICFKSGTWMHLLALGTVTMW